MAYLVAKLLYQDELIPVATWRGPRARVARKLREIAQFPGVLTAHADEPDGELWIEIETEHGDLAADPVCFSAALARETLLKTGMRAARVDAKLSDEYAQAYIESIRQKQ